jgi:hypothetical protein
MLKPTFSLVINHTPWRPERVEALAGMVSALAIPNVDGTRTAAAGPLFINDTDYRGQEWQVAKVKWALDQWRWAVEQKTSHHVFMTDDLHIAPNFWGILSAMIQGSKAEAIGLLSNHPRGPRLFGDGEHAYRTNSWLVGPAYVLSHRALVAFLKWFEALPDGPHTTQGTKAWANDDSSINEWITRASDFHACWHPLPTIIEHRGDMESTVGHGDSFSRERVSWRKCQIPLQGPDGSTLWRDIDLHKDLLEKMAAPAFWAEEGRMLPVGGF